MVIGAKNHSSNMNDVCTMSSYDIVGCPTKGIQVTTFFSNSKHLFVQLLCWPLAGRPGVDL